MYIAVSKALNRIVAVQECDARMFNRITIAGKIKKSKKTKTLKNYC